MGHFYNTTNETNPELATFRRQAETQDDLVLRYFELMPQASPSQVHADILRTSPLTSVRRSISNLTADGKLVKTERKVQGPYGRPEYVWRLAGDARQRNLF